MKLPEKGTRNACGLYTLGISLGHEKHVRINSLNLIKVMHDTAILMKTNEVFRDIREIIRSRDH
jgi:hypothetical protein